MTGPGHVRPARIAAARLILLAVFSWFFAAGSVAEAQVTTFDALPAPIVRVNLRQGDITIRTWDRPTVSVDGDPSLVVQHRTVRQTGDPYSLPVPLAQASTPDGAAMLPAESFVVSSIPAGPRDAIFVKSPGGEGTTGGPPTSVTVTVPNGSVFVYAHTNGGTVDVRDYKGGTLFVSAFRGRVALANVGGAVFAQSTHGQLTITDSSFDRIRARSLTGNVTFERCHARQIEATSINGSIVYDGGTFEPGLARFESTRGDVAVGASGAAQIDAHAAGSGRVFTNFDRAAHIDGRDGQTSALIGGGGPVVNATSQGGNVYLYDGSLRTRGQMAGEWDGPIGALERPGVRAPRADVRPNAQPRGQYPPFNAPLPRYNQARPNAQNQGSPAPRKFKRRWNGRRKNPEPTSS